MMYKIQADLSSFTPSFQTSNKKILSLGECSFNEYNNSFSFAYSRDSSTLVMCGYNDNSVHMFEDFKETKYEMSYHKKMITCVAYDDERGKLNEKIERDFVFKLK